MKEQNDCLLKARFSFSDATSFLVLFVLPALRAWPVHGWTPSLQSVTCKCLLSSLESSKSSYEEQYAAMCNAAQQNQPATNCNNDVQDVYVPIGSNSFPSANFQAKANGADSSQQGQHSSPSTPTSSYLTSFSSLSAAEQQKQGAFLDFISTSQATAQFQSSSLSSKPYSYADIRTTTLKFSNFTSTSRIRSLSEIIDLAAENVTVLPNDPSSSLSLTSRSKSSLSSPHPASITSGLERSTSYLDSLSGTDSRTWIPPAVSSCTVPSRPSLTPITSQNPDKDKRKQKMAQEQDIHTRDGTSFVDTTITDLTSSKVPPANINLITVQCQTLLPADVSVHQAKQAWLEYCWEQGAGIMVPTFGASPLLEDCSDQSIFGSSNSDIVAKTREFLIPYGIKQELVPINNENKDVTVVGYRTTRRGPFWQDIIEGSHMATVEFITEREDQKYEYFTRIPPTRMIWKVQFQVNGTSDTTTTPAKSVSTSSSWEFDSSGWEVAKSRLRYMLSREAFWKSWTKFHLETATTNFISYLRTADNLLSIDHKENMPKGVTPQQALDGWYEFCWRKGGGGSTLIPPITFQRGRQRWVLPAFLEEEIVSMSYGESCHVIYQVNNPNPVTFPVHYNQGKLRFEQRNANTPTVLLWNVQVLPYRKFLGNGIRFWTKGNMVIVSRNLRTFLLEKQKAQEVS